MRKKFNAALDQARKDLEVIKKTYGENSSEYQKSKQALGIYGDLGQKNGVTIYARSQQAQGGETAVLQGTKTKDNPIGQDIRISFRKDAFDSNGFGGLIGHEGRHGADGSDWLKGGMKNSMNPTEYQFEFDGHFVQSVLAEVSVTRRKEAGGFASSRDYWQTSGNPPVQIESYNTGWAEADKATIRRTNIDRWLAIPKSEGGSYGVTPSTKKKHF